MRTDSAASGRMMHGWFELPLVQYTSLLARIKVLAGLDIAERYRPQDGHFSFSQNDRTFHLRVAVMRPCMGKRLCSGCCPNARSLTMRTSSAWKMLCTERFSRCWTGRAG